MVSGKVVQEPKLGDGNVKADREALLHWLSCGMLRLKGLAMAPDT